MDTRPPPPGAPRFGYNRVYRTNLRPVIISVAAITALWTLLSGIGYFRSISIHNQQGFPHLATFSIVLGAMFTAIAAIEAFGVVAAVMRSTPLVGLYAYGSYGIALLLVGTAVLQVVVHFTAKGDIISECTNLASNQSFAIYPFGWFGPERHETLSPAEANSWCNSIYDRNSWQDIVSLIIDLLLAFAFIGLAWGYYRQLLDPTSVANFTRAPPTHVMYPVHYTPPYGASVPNLSYNAPQQYAPPPGAPPMAKPPGMNMPGADGSTAYGRQDDKENPFADFDEASSHAHERDVTSRPGPGGRETF